MNEQNMIILGVAAAIALYMVKMPKAKAATSAAVPAGATEIIPQGDAAGWRYFSDGTAIDANGVYYKGGNVVYNPDGTMPA